jgi:hypothetical protein
MLQSSDNISHHDAITTISNPSVWRVRVSWLWHCVIAISHVYIRGSLGIASTIAARQLSGQVAIFLSASKKATIRILLIEVPLLNQRQWTIQQRSLTKVSGYDLRVMVDIQKLKILGSLFTSVLIYRWEISLNILRIDQKKKNDAFWQVQEASRHIGQHSRRRVHQDTDAKATLAFPNPKGSSEAQQATRKRWRRLFLRDTELSWTSKLSTWTESRNWTTIRHRIKNNCSCVTAAVDQKTLVLLYI